MRDRISRSPTCGCGCLPPAAFGAHSAGSWRSPELAPEEVHKVHTRVNLGTSEVEVHTRFTRKFISKIKAFVNLVNLVNLFHPHTCARMYARWKGPEKVHQVHKVHKAQEIRGLPACEAPCEPLIEVHHVQAAGRRSYDRGRARPVAGGVQAGGTVRLDGTRCGCRRPSPCRMTCARDWDSTRPRSWACCRQQSRSSVRHRFPSRMTGFARIFRPRWPTASEPFSQLTVRGSAAQSLAADPARTRHLIECGWLHAALDLGWSRADLFGCDQRAPWYRLDRSGLVLLMGGHEIVELSSDMATLRTRTGSVLRHRRRPPARPPVALLWEVLTSRAHPTGWPPAEATGPPIRGPTARPSEEADGGDVLGRTPPPS